MLNRILAPFQQLFERAAQQWMGFTQRERRLVSLLGVALVLTVIALGVSSSRKSYEARQGAIAQKTIALEQVVALSAGYREAEAMRGRIESRLRGAPIRLFSYLEEIAKRQNIDIGDMQDRGSENRDGVSKSTVEVRFASIELRPLVEFLNEIEMSPRVVKVEKLRVRHRNDDPDLLDVNLIVSTYHLADS